MSDETTQFILGDAAADALSQGRRGRGFFGRRRKKQKDERQLTHCENCQAPLIGPYCAKCGQHAIDYRRSLVRVLIDAADSFLNWDTKFLQSVGVLITRPWRLTNDFNAGRRARYVHPLRLYLLASIAFFLLARLINFAPSGPTDLTLEDRAEVDQALSKLTGPDSQLTPEKREKLETVRKLFGGDAALSAEDRSRLDKTVSKFSKFADKKQLKSKDVTRIDALLDQIPGLSPTPVPTEGENASGVIPSPSPAVVPTPSPTPKPNPIIQFDNKDSDDTPFGKWIQQRVKDKVGEDGTKAQLFFDTLRSNVPTMMLFCVPAFAFVLKVLYLFCKRFYVEHLVYALHIHTFAYIATVLITLTSMGFARVAPSLEVLRILLTVALSIVAAVQVFVSIRRVYGQGWFVTTFKFLVGGFAYLMILVTAVALTAFVTILLPS